ncbi:MAG TPA: protein kinase [Candidatus Eisenbacteria bacterium]|nr:protein kinase [Candidatus Eisenbacteria bacterium]
MPAPGTPATIERIAHYRVTRKLGEGGMGVVYAAEDERLGRNVAIKMIRAGVADPTARERLWREARSAAAVNHPNVCQLYEVGDANGELYLAMELLEGESLAERISRGPLMVSEAGHVALAILDALAPLHRQGVLHRDLKPSNVFLTPLGVKLLDFGLAGSISGMGGPTNLTRSDMVVGTPHYVSPEQLEGREVDGRADLFAVGAVLYEMLCGRQAFPGQTVAQIFNAILREEPPQLGGSEAVASLERVLRRAIAKRPERRYPTAEAMAIELRAALLLAGSSGSTMRAQPLHRLLVLPFRMLRPDEDIEFLAFSLPDAISNSLSSLDSVVVRSSMAAARLKLEDLDLAEVSTKADVDMVLTGTLLRAGDQLRVANQLVDARDGSVIWSQTSQVSMGDIFQLQDGLTRRIVESLPVRLSAHDESALRRDAPRHPKAYELYLRANRLGQQASQWGMARDLYLECLDLDADFAPAWAGVGRLYRILALYASDEPDALYEKAQQAFQKALELSPDLPMAHHLFTNVEVDLGQAQQAMVRLLKRAASHPTDAELFAGLVQSCRYCGLLDASIAAYEHAFRLDKTVRTSVHHAYLMRGDYQTAIDTDIEDMRHVTFVALDMSGRREEAVQMAREIEAKPLPAMLRSFVELTRVQFEGRNEEAAAILRELVPKFSLRDPCSKFYVARQLSAVGEHSQAMRLLGDAVDGGFSAFEFMTRDPWLSPLRGTEEFRSILRRAELRERQARAAFIEAGGERVLGIA